MDLPAPPPRWGDALTRSDMATALVPVFEDRSEDSHHLALFIDQAMDRLMAYGLAAPWGVNDRGAVLFEAREAEPQLIIQLWR